MIIGVYIIMMKMLFRRDKCMFIEDTQILQVLRGYNPWWATKQVPASFAPPVKRLAFYEIVSLLNRNDLHRTIILSGARRVGKTTILYQLCQYFIENGVPADHILYATFDHPILKMTSLQQVVEIFINNVSADNRNLVLLFDEIHLRQRVESMAKTARGRKPDIQDHRNRFCKRRA
jgi:Predicted ATPase (AAA+ superfamily)